MSKNLAAFKAVINTAENTVVQLQNFSQHKGGRPKLAKRVGGIWFKVRPHHDVDDENRDPGIWCSYHPNGQRKDRPWKKFLENANFQALDGSLNHKITQLMPISGLKMLRRNQSMYQVVRRTFAAAQRVTHHHPKDKYELSQATGEDYNMLHVEHDVGAQTTFPFFTGEKKKYDSKGVVTLEYLSKAFHAFQRRRHLNPTDRFIGGKLVRV